MDLPVQDHPTHVTPRLDALIGELRERMDKANQTAAEEATGVSRDAIFNFRRGKGNPSLDLIRRLAVYVDSGEALAKGISRDRKGKGEPEA